MPKPGVRVPSLVQHKPSGRACVRIAGRDIWLGKWGSPQAEERYRRVVAEYLAHGRLPAASATAGSSDGPLVNELILAYGRHAKGYYRKDGKETSQLGLIKGVLRLLREHYGLTPTAEFDAARLEAIREMLVRSGLTRTGVNRRIDSMRRAFKWGLTKKLVPAAVFQELAAVEGLKKGRTEAPDPPPVRPVPEADLAATLPHLPPVVRDMVLLQLLCGARPGGDVRPAAGRPGPSGRGLGVPAGRP